MASGVRRCWHLQLFLASAASKLALQEAILPHSHTLVADYTKIKVEEACCTRSSSPISETTVQHIQTDWDAPIVNSVLSTIIASAVTDLDHAKLKAASTPHFGDWLQRPPIASLGLKLTDDEVRISVALRLGIRICSPHNCICEKLVDAIGLHGLSCRRRTPRHQRHAMLNDIILRSIKRAQIPVHNEAKDRGLVSQGGKKPDGVTMIPWARGKPLAWDVTVPDTNAESHIFQRLQKHGRRPSVQRHSKLRSTRTLPRPTSSTQSPSRQQPAHGMSRQWR